MGTPKLYEYRRPTRSWVRVIVRQCRELGHEIEVLREGEPDRGTVALCITQREEGYSVITQARNADGHIFWIPVFGERQVAKAEAQDYLIRAVRRDPDLWIIEIESTNGRNLFPTALP
ncbi:MAG: DUF1491 family protein [Pseudomonadota bacterium]